MDCPPTHQFCVDFSPSASVANRYFPLSRTCGETGLHTLQGANHTAAQWFTLVQGA